MQNCSVCTKNRLWQSTKKLNNKTGARIWICRNCGNEQSEVPAQRLRKDAKVLYLDIETALMSVDVYDLLIRSKFIQPSYIIEHSYVINWAAAWLDSEWNIKGGIKSDCVTQAESKRRNDKRIIKGIWELMDEADYICGHNSDNFDIKKLNWRYLVHGLNFPAQYKTLDTFKWAGRYTKPPSKGLEPLSVMLGYEPKDGLTADEWREIVHQGTPRLLNKSDRYCRGDVRNGVAVLGRYARAIEASGKELVKW